MRSDFGGIDEDVEMTNMDQKIQSGPPASLSSGSARGGSIYQSLEAAEANQSGSIRGSMRGVYSLILSTSLLANTPSFPSQTHTFRTFVNIARIL